MRHTPKLLLASIFSIGLSATASAQIVVHGAGQAQQCYMSAKTGNPGRISALKTCEEALKLLDLTRKDQASTHVNYGILLMRKGDYTAAQEQYSKALDIKPKLPEAHINHAASLIYTRDYNAAIKASNIAIELGTEKMPEALYNRAMAYDSLQDYKSAYKDLKQALVLKPDWPIALKALDNYVVSSASKVN